MTSPRITVKLAPLAGRAAFEDRLTMAGLDEPDLTLGQLLADRPALSCAPISPELLEIRVSRLNVEVTDPDAQTAFYWPLGPGVDVAVSAGAPGSGATADAPAEPAAVALRGAKPTADHPAAVEDADAVRMAHDEEITKAAAYLDAGLSVLIRCEKLIVEHLAGEIVGRTKRRAIVAEASAQAGTAEAAMMQPGRRQQVLAALQEAVRTANPATDVIVVAHLDLLAGGIDASLSTEARELTDVLYEPSSDATGQRRGDCVLLAFVDPSLVVPEVLANRFAVRLAIDILPRVLITAEGKEVPIGVALVTEAEKNVFAGYDPVDLYKHVAGMNALRLRHAIRFAVHQHGATGATFAELLAELRRFKASTSSSSFEVPNVKFKDIGGYADVETELRQALALIKGGAGIPEELHQDLIPRGFILYGPPGTGKTLFAKAVATDFDATIVVVSGPEVTDMYVGESERKVREIFAEARRNAPSVVVFDEFDSIAAKRTGRDDGGGRAGNAIVAQLLTEMDGFRSAVPVLIIGTTNQLKLIDPALLRPSRFRAIKIDLPDYEARRAIAKVHADHFQIPVEDPVLDAIARATKDMNGDEIRSIFRDARAEMHVGTSLRTGDARHLGEIVGRLRRTAQNREQEQKDGVNGRAS